MSYPFKFNLINKYILPRDIHKRDDLIYLTSVVTYTNLMFVFSNNAFDSVKKQVKEL